MVKRLRRGFTLVELLVVIAIIGILVALLLPAVQQAREAARRNGCLNNSRQITLSMLNFESATQRFPVAGDAFDSNGNSVDVLNDLQAGGMGYQNGGFSWLVRILPYIEEQALFDAIKSGTTQLRDNAFVATATITATSATGEVEHVASAPISPYICPSFPGDEQATGGAYDRVQGGAAAGTYVAMIGTHQTSGGLVQNGALQFATNARSRGSTIGGLSDGTSKTIIIGESQEEDINSWYDAAATWATAFPLDEAINPADSNGDRIWDQNLHSTGLSAQQYGPDPNNTVTAGFRYNPNLGRSWGPSSAHSGIVIYSFGDNHTRSVSNEVDAGVLAALVTKNGGESVSENEF